MNVDALVGQPGQAVSDGARLSALYDLGLLDSEAEEEFDRYTRLASDLLGVPVSLVSLVTADRQFFKSQTGLPAGVTETPLSHSFCQHGHPLAARRAEGPCRHRTHHREPRRRNAPGPR